MIKKETVESFLNTFKVKVRIFGLLFENDRDKNEKALSQLDITPARREQIVLSIKTENFSQILDSYDYEGTLWVFGVDVKDQEVYIKISLGYDDNTPICISFHIAEYKMAYPFKNE